jgi:CheY-like chemotaxis protein/anti-sigma regulatory factor (Ser/Thr protein kinase)
MKLRQILINLVTNAIKFTSKGSVKVRAFEQNGWLECAVVDTGIGINKEDQKRIFEEFHQVKSGRSQSDEGSGLGLTLTKKLIELLGGTIDLESEPGKGSTFTFRVPTVLGSTREISLISPEVAASAAISTLDLESKVQDETQKGEKQILCIDDNPDVAELLSEHLTGEGFTIQVALSAEEGLKKIRKNRPFAVMLDILMPQKNGWEFLREIKKDKELAGIPIIIVSIVDDKKLGFALGASDYIVKPFDKEAILKALQKLMLPRDANILIVEDNPDDAQLMCEILREDYPNLLIASNGRKALEMLDRNLPSLILLDLMMPVMDGMEFLEEMRRNPRWIKTPVMVVTAKALTQEDYNRLNGNINKVLYKNSLTKERLAIEVNKLLSSLH